jgi:hypothetical protein
MQWRCPKDRFRDPEEKPAELFVPGFKRFFTTAAPSL